MEDGVFVVEAVDAERFADFVGFVGHCVLFVEGVLAVGLFGGWGGLWFCWAVASGEDERCRDDGGDGGDAFHTLIVAVGWDTASWSCPTLLLHHQQKKPLVWG